MRSSGWTPSIVPNGDDQTVYLVKDDLGRLGGVWREADAEATDLETVITDLLTGHYSDPIRVVAFNTVERWSHDVSKDVAHELRRRCDLQLRDVPSSISVHDRCKVLQLKFSATDTSARSSMKPEMMSSRKMSPSCINCFDNKDK
jgi:hypothetical protein